MRRLESHGVLDHRNCPTGQIRERISRNPLQYPHPLGPLMTMSMPMAVANAMAISCRNPAPQNKQA